MTDIIEFHTIVEWREPRPRVPGMPVGMCVDFEVRPGELPGSLAMLFYGLSEQYSLQGSITRAANHLRVCVLYPDGVILRQRLLSNKHPYRLMQPDSEKTP